MLLAASKKLKNKRFDDLIIITITMGSQISKKEENQCNINNERDKMLKDYRPKEPHIKKLKKKKFEKMPNETELFSSTPNCILLPFCGEDLKSSSDISFKYDIDIDTQAELKSSTININMMLSTSTSKKCKDSVISRKIEFKINKQSCWGQMFDHLFNIISIEELVFFRTARYYKDNSYNRKLGHDIYLTEKISQKENILIVIRHFNDHIYKFSKRDCIETPYLCYKNEVEWPICENYYGKDPINKKNVGIGTPDRPRIYSIRSPNYNITLDNRSVHMIILKSPMKQYKTEKYEIVYCKYAYNVFKLIEYWNDEFTKGKVPLNPITKQPIEIELIEVLTRYSKDINEDYGAESFEFAEFESL